MAREAPEAHGEQTTTLRQQLMVHFHVNPDKAVTAQELAKILGAAPAQIEAELKELVALGQVVAQRGWEDGTATYHSPPEVRRKLGQLLVEAGFITEQQLSDALAEQEKTGDKLGRILIERGYVPKQIIGQILEAQQGVPYVNLSTYPVDVGLLRSIPEALITEHKVMPLVRKGNEIHLAMVDPGDIIAIDQVSFITKARVKVFLTTESDFAVALGKHFDVQRRVTERLEDVEETPDALEGQAAAVQMSESPYDPPVVRLVDSVIQGAIRDGATDIHIEPQEDETSVRYRIDGLLYDKARLPRGVAAAVASRVKVLSGLDISEHVRPQDGRILLADRGREYDMRVATVGSIFGERVTIRLLDKSRLLRGMEHLGLLPAQEAIIVRLLQRPYGMILVTGPTGCGKTTTLYAAINSINERSRNIMTVEDPVEYHLDGITQIPARTKMGVTFAAGLRAIMRQDPDVIMVGEVRDPETAQTTVQAALTGHLVLTTLHTNNAAGAVVRLIEMGVEPYLITSSMLAAVGQRLIRTLCECRESYTASPELLDELGIPPGGDPVVFYRAKGCPECGHLGYKGRTGIYEVMLATDEIRDLILQRRPAASIHDAAVAAGMMTMRENGLEKAKAGITTIEELRRVILADTTKRQDD
ncbi:MAG TPA: ATPase, T2SS/T4P/T4SS family [bacterium]|nr:ATPase, T2SS/T4P/T4SS family [bacterium]